jgi:hypothetical protein
VILTARAAFQRATRDAVGGGVAASATFGGPAALRAAMCGCGMDLWMLGTVEASRHLNPTSRERRTEGTAG